MKQNNLLKWHSLFGLVSGLFILMMGITGSILVFHKEIDETIEKEYLFLSHPSPVINLDRAINNIQTNYPDWDIRITNFNKSDQAIVFDLRQPDQNKRLKIFVHPETAKILKTINANRHFSRWLLKLHYSLHAGTTGRIIIFIVGILFLSTLVTGIYLYRSKIIKVLLFKVKIKKKNNRTLLSSWHRIIGSWALILNLLLAITGVFISYTVVQSGLNPAASPRTVALQYSMQASLKSLQESHPDFDPSYIKLSSSSDKPVTVSGTFSNDSSLWSKYYNKITLNNKNGEILKIIKICDESAGYKLNSMLHPLHYGEYLGFISKLIYCLIGLSGPALSVTGFFLFILRKKKNN